MGKEVIGEESISGIFDIRRKEDVIRFARSRKRAALIDRDPAIDVREVARPPTGVTLRTNESVVTIKTQSGIESEALLLAMDRSGLFRYVWPQFTAGYGGGADLITTLLADRGELFNTPESPSQSEALEKLETFFTKHFKSLSAGAKVEVWEVGDDSFHFEVHVTGLRNVLIPGGNFWEQLEIGIIIGARLGLQANGLVIIFSFGGEYASGIWEHPPPPTKFKTLEEGGYEPQFMRAEKNVRGAFQKYFRSRLE